LEKPFTNQKIFAPRPKELGQASVPAFPGWLAALGPGIVWLALAQGSGELIWWPYMTAKYGLAFMFLLIPACLLQYPLVYEIGRYTMLTGESIFQGFIRLSRPLALFLWILMILSFLWFGAFATAGGTALAALTHFPPHWSARGQTFFWALVSIGFFLVAIFLSKVVYVLIERFMAFVAVITILGLIWACSSPEVLSGIPEFLKALVAPGNPAREWDPADATKFLTALTFAGLGGFWTLFYSFWLREKGVGMAAQAGHIHGIIRGEEKILTTTGCLPKEEPEAPSRVRTWLRFLKVDAGVGIFGNIFTTLLTCLLAFTLLLPRGLVPQEYELAVVQSRFFEVKWGVVGGLVFLFVAAAFLSDTWITTLDSVSRAYAEMITSFFSRARSIFSLSRWYYLVMIALVVVTTVTMFFDAPGPLILISAVIGFIGTVTFTTAILILNHFYLPKLLPQWARPSRLSLVLISITCLAYFVLATVYLYLKFSG
jgi:hypothetical protein